MRLNEAGELVQSVWDDLPNHYAVVELDAFVIMPNHVHGVIVLTDVGAGFKPAPTKHGLSKIIRGFKTYSSRRINEMRQTPGVSIRQRNYYEHIIRDDESLNRIREYIANNPIQWELDRENPNVVRGGSNPPLRGTNHGASDRIGDRPVCLSRRVRRRQG